MIPRLLCFVAAALVLLSGRAHAADRIAVTVTGRGPDVILIPGLASSASVWDTTVAQLKSGHRVHVVQVAGFAGTPVGGNAEGPVLGPLTEALHSYVVANHLKAPAVIGHSLGGVLGMNLALTHPYDVGRLMIVDSLPFFSVLVVGPTATVESATPSAAAFRDRILAGGQAAYAAGQPAAMKRLIKSTGPAAEAAVAASAASDYRLVARTAYEVMTTDLRPRVAELKLPVTMRYPWDASSGIPVETFDGLYKSAYAALPSGRLKRIDGSYHFIQLDQPEAFAAAVADFLK